MVVLLQTTSQPLEDMAPLNFSLMCYLMRRDCTTHCL